MQSLLIFNAEFQSAKKRLLKNFELSDGCRFPRNSAMTRGFKDQSANSGHEEGQPRHSGEAVILPGASKQHLFLNQKTMKWCLSLFTIYIIATSVVSGAGSATGGSALQREQGTQLLQLYNQGVQLMHAKKFAEAQVKFQEAVSAKPYFAEAHNNLGYSLRKQGTQNYAKALEHYNQAIQLKPNLAEAYEYRGVLFLKMGRKAEAEKDVATLKTLNPKLAAELEHVIQTGNEE